MLNSANLAAYKQTTITDGSGLVDLRDVIIDPEQPLTDRMINYLDQIKNPYLFKIGEMKVKIRFGNQKSLVEALGVVFQCSANPHVNGY